MSPYCGTKQQYGDVIMVFNHNKKINHNVKRKVSAVMRKPNKKP